LLTCIDQLAHFYFLFIELILHALGEMVLLVVFFIYFSYVRTFKK